MKLSIKAKLIILFLLIISGSLFLISERGLKYLGRDKETYIQALNAQNIMLLSGSLADRIESLGKVAETFADFNELKFASEAEREKAQRELLLKFRDFLSVSVFKMTPAGPSELFGIYDSARLKASMFSRQDLTKSDLVTKIYGSQQAGKIKLLSLVKQSEYPLVLLSVKRDNGIFVLTSVFQKSLMSVIGKKEIFKAFVVDGDGRLVMDQNPQNLLMNTDFSKHPMAEAFLSDKDARFSGMTKEYRDPSSGEEMLGSFAHLGNTGCALVIELPKKLAYVAGKELIRKLAIWILVIFCVAVVATLVFSSTITNPLKDLARFASKVGKGEFNAELPKKTNDELGDLVTAFNKMNSELVERENKIEETHKQLVQSEKMGAFGQMSAGIAHEVKNPLAGILGYAQIAKKKATPESGITSYLDIIEKETKRCKDIVENLMKFARAEKATLSDININQVVKDSVALVDHQITISGIKIERKLMPDDATPIVWGNANQITQVLTNIMLNAQYAMKKKGEGGLLTVEVKPKSDSLVDIVLSDTGSGIKQENLVKIFDPFFTTKPAGEGTGLGLSVTYGIVKEHKGEIRAESEYGQWTRFIITLPLKKG